ncbi:MAG: nitrate reductase [Rhodospirillaceae bacterium]|jgi:nitrate reductase gamma subunit|nr:nitrate reductase [Rhodospirillaceae bacterium]MBT4219696.1 nitrate reductase [Rhodospirillaceae bacterium]MBT4463519.1 nitrate reductase [Rhodospirillaceae bacterium]MBT5013660.1 nitrate reductase [Rhodospirillaceae bacterium]MBT5308172.1 nitrate reductase [Rhodospirillaceae bacterium]
MTFLEFTEGPLWYAAAAAFVVGVVWRFIGIIAFGRKPDLSTPRASAQTGAVRSIFLHFVPHGGFASKTGFHAIAGYLFHIGLFVLLAFAVPHIVFISEEILGLPAGVMAWGGLSHWGFIVVAEIAFLGIILLWIRRFTDPVSRMISDADDYIGTVLTFLVMLTGCFALGESSEALRAIHMLMVDAWLIYFPFSRLMHAFTFVLSRGYTGALFGRRGVTP